MKFKISKPVSGMLSAISFFCLMSCGDLQQNLIINADGSGTLETSIDMGEMMAMMQGMGDMGELINEDITVSGDTEIEAIEIDTTAIEPEIEEEPQDPMREIMERITNPAYDRDFDTLMVFNSMIPDSVQEKNTRPDLLEKISLRMRSPANSASLNVGIVINFDNKDHLNEIVNYLGSLDEESSSGMLAGAGGGSLAPESFLIFDADLKGGWIRFDSIDYRSFTGDMGMPGDTSDTAEDTAMLEMMFGNSKIKSVIHVPGDVTSCTNSDAILTKDNKVIVEYGFMDVVRKGKVPGYTIYFTPK